MIGFGELRKLSLQWQIDLADVERAYATDWLLKHLFDEYTLGSMLVLRSSSALRHAHFVDYVFADDPEFLAVQPIDATMLVDALTVAPNELKFALIDLERGSAKVEYIGPLGRRSAAQPRLTLSFIAGKARIDSVRAPLIHRFSDACAATVAALSLEELAAERIAILGTSPRVRDVFDLWFILTHTRAQIDSTRIKSLAQEIARDKHLTLSNADSIFNPSHRNILERGWDAALRQTLHRPTFAQVEQDLTLGLEKFLAY